MRLLFVFISLVLSSFAVLSQDIVKMEKSGGVYLIPCKVNGLPLKFIFDTGASDVSISLTEAVFMLKNGYLKESDIKGTVYYSIANGEIEEGTKIIIQKIEVGKQILYNVEASIVHSSDAPLLFGQSAMERFGKFTFDYANLNLTIGGASNSPSVSTSSGTIKSVQIGTQIWSSENFNSFRFRNGDSIPEAKTQEEWANAGLEERPAWCYYKFSSVEGAKYGKLYNWFAVNDPRGLAPIGWHIPSKDDWENLRDFLGGNRNAAIKLKSTTGWNNLYTSFKGTNTTKFSALPGGFCNFISLGGLIQGGFGDLGYGSFFWTSTICDWRTDMIQTVIINEYKEGFNFNDVMPHEGHSIRLLRD